MNANLGKGDGGDKDFLTQQRLSIRRAPAQSRSVNIQPTYFL